MAAGAIVERLGILPAMRLFLLGIATSTALIALSQEAGVVLASGLVFGAFFVLVAAALGMWSLELFPNLPALGFGMAFLLLSARQFVGPIPVGTLIGRFDLSQPFLASAAFSVVLVAVLPRRGGSVQPDGLTSRPH